MAEGGVTVDAGAGTAGGGAVLGREGEVEGRESTRLVNEAAGPPFSKSLLFGPILGLAGPSPSFLVPPSLVSEAAMRASSRRVFRVSRLKWTRLKSRASLMAVTEASSLLVSLFHLAESPGAGGAGGPGGS